MSMPRQTSAWHSSKENRRVQEIAFVVLLPASALFGAVSQLRHSFLIEDYRLSDKSRCVFKLTWSLILPTIRKYLL